MRGKGFYELDCSAQTSLVIMHWRQNYICYIECLCYFIVTELVARRGLYPIIQCRDNLSKVLRYPIQESLISQKSPCHHDRLHQDSPGLIMLCLARDRGRQDTGHARISFSNRTWSAVCEREERLAGSQGSSERGVEVKSVFYSELFHVKLNMGLL